MKNPFQFIDPSTREVLKNSLGYQQVISTLTAVSKKLSEQKFYTIPFADYVPVVMGQGAFSRAIINWRSFVKGEGFKTGLISNAGNQSRLELVDSAFDELSQNVITYAKAVQYSVIELEEAMRANSIFSLIESRLRAQRTEWDLGLQEVAFKGVGSETGLLNNANVAVDSTHLTKRLYDMTSAEFNTFVGTVVGYYRAACKYTAFPNRFIVPEQDFRGLANYPNADYPLKTRLALLEEAFQLVTMQPGFKILPCAYCDKANFDASNNRYVLLNYDETSVKMDIPVQLTQTSAGTTNGFSWESAGYGQFTGVISLRPLEMYYFSNTAA